MPKFLGSRTLCLAFDEVIVTAPLGYFFLSSSVGASGTFNIGLNLKFNKSNQEIQGYSKKDETGTWLYSTKVIDLIRDYMAK